MQALVTGAGGFLGGRLAQVLAARGHAVRILARPSNDLTHLAGLSIEVVQGSLGDTQALEKAVERVTHIYHCAAKSTDWAAWNDYHEANVAGTENLLRAAAGARELQRFLHVSTTDVYGYPKQTCDESHQPVDVGLPYNRTKIMAERLALAADLPVTVVRPATIYGPRSVPFAVEIAKLIRQRLMAVIDGGRATGGFCYVDNAVEGILLAAASPESRNRIYNLSDGTGVTWKTYVDALADGLGCGRPWIDLPSRSALFLATMMEKLQARPLLTRHAVYLLSRNQEFPNARAVRELGYTPTVSFKQGMQNTIDWLRRAGSAP